MGTTPVATGSTRSSRCRAEYAASLCVVAVFAIFLTACAGTGSQPKEQIAVTISSPSQPVALFATNKVQFTATVTGSLDRYVSWQVVEAGGGAIDSTGMYTAPAAAGTFHVIATSQADTTKSDGIAVSVTIPKPVFSSTPSTVAQEGIAYTYALAATDPAGTEIRFSLQGPEGATLDGNNVRWTPSADQARVTNRFTVSASTAAGGVQTQAWSVLPSGTIQVSDIDLYWIADDNGRVRSRAVANDLSDPHNFQVLALVPQADGGVVEIKGIGRSDGTASIPGVPAGEYWLQVRPGELYWTGASSFDYGTDFIGRPPTSPVTADLKWALSSLLPWDPSLDSLRLIAPNAGISYGASSIPDPGSTSFTSAEAYSGPDAREDTGYVLQRRHQSLSATVDLDLVTRMGVVEDLETDAEGGSLDVSAALSPLSSEKSLQPVFRASDYSALAAKVNPGFGFNFGSGELFVQPFLTDRAARSVISLLDFSVSDVSTDQTLGTVDYGTTFPSTWPNLFSYSEAGAVTVSIPGGGTLEIPAAIGSTVTDNSQTGAPVLSPVQDAQINGQSLFAASGVAGVLEINWTPPGTGVPNGYSVAIEPLQQDASGYYAADGVELYTTSTSITVPAGVLQPDKLYVITVTALLDGKANFSTAPWRSGYPMAWADAVSGLITYSGSSQAAASIGPRVHSDRSRAQVTSPPVITRQGSMGLSGLQGPFRTTHAQRRVELQEMLRRSRFNHNVAR